MAKLKASYKKQGDIPEGKEGDYAKDSDTGEWHLQVEEVDGLRLENATGLRKALEDERESVKGAGRLLKPLGWKRQDTEWIGGTNTETVSVDLSRLKKIDDDPDKGKADPKITKQWEDREAEINTKHKGEIDTRDTKLTKLTSDLFSVVAEKEAVTALTRHKGSARLLLPHVLSSIKVEESENGLPVAKVVDKDGKELMTHRSGQSGPMTIDEHVERMSKDKEWARGFEPEGISGSGATGDTGGGGPATGPSEFQMSESDARTNHGAYKALRAKAEKAGQSVEIVAD